MHKTELYRKEGCCQQDFAGGLDYGEIISLTCDGDFCQGPLVTACAVLWRHRYCRIHHHHRHESACIKFGHVFMPFRLYSSDGFTFGGLNP